MSRVPPTLNLQRRILRYVRPYRGVFAVAVVGMLLVASTDVMMLRIVQPLAGGPRFDLGQVGDDLVHLRATGFLWLGLIAVVATPASRVVASLVGYLHDGERLMAVVAVLILAVIVLSVGLAIGLEG